MGKTQVPYTIRPKWYKIKENRREIPGAPGVSGGGGPPGPSGLVSPLLSYWFSPGLSIANTCCPRAEILL